MGTQKLSAVVPDKEHVDRLRKSSQQLKMQLQSVIIDDKTDEVLVGKHRKMADPDWKEHRVKVTSKMQRELIILNGNVQRVVSQEETAHRLRRIAEMVEAMGIPSMRVAAYMAKKCPIPYSEEWIRRLLPSKYKMKSMARIRKEKEIAEVVLQTQTEALETRQHTMQPPVAQTDYPFKNCMCRGCPNHDGCY